MSAAVLIAVKLPAMLDMYMNLALAWLLDSRSNGATALNNSNWPYTLTSTNGWMSEISDSKTLGLKLASPALARTTSRLSMLCSDVKDATPRLMVSTEATSISMTTSRESEALGRRKSESAEEAFRTAATTMVLGELRYAATRPLPIPDVQTVSTLFWIEERNVRTATCARDKDSGGREHC